VSNNFRMIWDNSKFDAATLTASSEAANLPVTNLQDTKRRKVWRTTGITGQYFTADLGDNPKTVHCVAFVNHNFTTTATVTITASNASDFSDPVYSASDVRLWQNVYPWGAGSWGEGSWGGGLSEEDRNALFISPIRIIWTGAVKARYWKFEFADDSNTDGYFEIGRVFISPYFEPKYNFAHGWEIGIKEDTVITKSVGKQKWVDEKPWYHVIKLPLHAIAETDKYSGFIAMCKRLGVRKDFILDLFPNATETSKELYNTFYGSFTENPVITGRYNRYSQSQLVFEESL